MTWDKVKLGDISLLVQTGPFGSQLHQSDYSKHGTPVVMPKNIKDGKINEEEIAKVSAEQVKRLRRHQLKRGDIVYARRGDIGRCAYIGSENEGWLCGTGCLKISLDHGKANSKFIYYYLQLDSIIGWVTNHAVGSTMLNLNTEILKDIPLCLPDIDNQQKIASILSAYDDLIENNHRQIKLLEEAAERLYKEWFVKFHYPGWETHLHDSKEEGWRTGTLSDIGEFNRGKTIISANIESGPIPVIAGGISPSFYCNEYNVIGPVITISASGANAGYVNLYHENVWASDCSFLGDSATKYLYWIYCFLKSNPNILLNLQKGSAQPHVYAKDVNQIELLIPPKRILTSFESEAAALYSQIAKFDRMITLLQEARDRLLPKLMSGEVEV
ncbi:restriction endonuclease subunit S [Dialister succinatiphilus]|jgi:type I restriction enzyme S subunit|uniref:restriction endonuclease subunit S n=1 Tax=Dialister succinatiphilus TaxID=487173 RepID=UPI0023565935|nr:restriction endonuclease subunit S [Dialister succinatiphilus]